MVMVSGDTNREDDDGVATMVVAALPTPTNPTIPITSTSTSDTKKGEKKKKPRYTKAKKRELHQNRLLQEEEDRKLNKKPRKRRRPQSKQNRKSELPKDSIDRILQCAEKSLFTDSIVVENKEDDSIPDVGERTSAIDHNTDGDNTTVTDQRRLIVEIVSGCNRYKHRENGNQNETAKQNTSPEPLSLPLSHLGHRLFLRTTCTIKVQPLLVLDLNGILCHRDRKRTRTEFWNKLQASIHTTDTPITAASAAASRPWELRPSIGNVANSAIVPRTDLLEFLHYLDRHFCLAVWTSAKPKTAKKLLNRLLSGEDHSTHHSISNTNRNRMSRGRSQSQSPSRSGHNPNDCKGIRSRLLFVWSQSQCTAVRSSKSNTNTHTKDLPHQTASDPMGTEIVATIDSTTTTNDASTSTSTSTSTIITIPSDPIATPPTTDIHDATATVTVTVTANANASSNSASPNQNPPDSTAEPDKNDDDEHSFDDSIVFEKHLSKIWEAYPLWSANNTLLIDDSPEKCPMALANAIHPPPLHGRRPPRSSGPQYRHGPPQLSTDEDNEDRQACFFKALVDFWTHCPYVTPPWTASSTSTSTTKGQTENENGDLETTTEALPLQGAAEIGGTVASEATITNTRYYEFLRTHARGHMGWRDEPPAATTL